MEPITDEPQRDKTCLLVLASNTGAHQPAHSRSLISVYVICFLERIICKLAIGEISIFYLVSVAEETGLILALLESPKICFLAMWPRSQSIYGTMRKRHTAQFS